MSCQWSVILLISINDLQTHVNLNKGSIYHTNQQWGFLHTLKYESLSKKWLHVSITTVQTKKKHNVRIILLTHLIRV